VGCRQADRARNGKAYPEVPPGSKDASPTDKRTKSSRKRKQTRDYTGKSKQIDLELQAEAEKALWTARTMAPELKSGGFEEGWPLTQGC
jgi:hypothetical protein